MHIYVASEGTVNFPVEVENELDGTTVSLSVNFTMPPALVYLLLEVLTVKYALLAKKKRQFGQ